MCWYLLTRDFKRVNGFWGGGGGARTARHWDTNTKRELSEQGPYKVKPRKVGPCDGTSRKSPQREVVRSSPGADAIQPPFWGLFA